MAYFFLWRRSEYLAVDGAAAEHAVAVGDVAFLDSRDDHATRFEDISIVQVHIRGSKTDQARRGVHLRIGPTGADWLCPVAAAWTLLQHASTLNLPRHAKLCSIDSTSTLSCDILTKKIKAAAAACGEDPSEYSTHSLRSGGATALFRGGVPDLAIQKMGRWASDAFKNYARIDEQTVADLAPRMLPRAWRSI